jgi:hypothetical protein
MSKVQTTVTGSVIGDAFMLADEEDLIGLKSQSELALADPKATLTQIEVETVRKLIQAIDHELKRRKDACN